MRRISFVKKMGTGIKGSFRRFSQAIALSIMCVILIIVISEMRYEVGNDQIENLIKITMVLGFGIPFSLCINIFFERFHNFKRSFFIGAYLAEVLLLSGYYNFLLEDLEMLSITRYIGFSLIFYLAFLCIPYILQKENFELYVIKIIVRFFTTLLYAVILFLGLTIVLITVDQLFGVSMKEELYFYMWIIVIGVFASMFFLAGIPKKSTELHLEDYSKIIKMLVLYIIVPLISVYTVILYIYFAKIIVTRQWPQGLVSHLVLWYSIMSVIVLFLITPLRNKITWVKTYMKIYPKTIILLLIMMFISIGIRINDYGVTGNRYFVVVFGIWVILAMIYFSFKKKLVNIILPMSLVVIIFISIFGPLSNDSISSYSQNKRFEKLLIENNMLKDGKVIKATSDVPDEDVIQISNILMYFKDNLTLKDIKSLPEDFCMEDMEDVLGIKYDSGYYDNKKNKYFNFRIDEKLNVIDIKGYDYFFNLMNLEQIDLKDKKMRLIYDDKSLVFKIYQNEEVVYHKNLEEFVEKLMERYEFNQYNDNMPLKDMLLIEENDKIKVKIVFIDISGNINESIGEIKSPRFDTNIFLKIK